MRVALVGGTGMIGTALAAALAERGDEIVVITRGKTEEPGYVQWDPARGISQPHLLERLDVVVNLAGAPIADRPWSPARRKVLLDSRVEATATLLDGLGKLDAPPPVYVGVGGLGVFGDRGEDVVGDEEPPGTGFLAELALAWEQAHLEATERIGARTSVLRMGMVLASHGGALPRIVTPFRYGMGGWLGNGRQYTSWISAHDAVRALVFLAVSDGLTGCFNGTVPEPIPNKEWCKALGRALHRPVLTHAPKWALRGALGELADGLFLASLRAVPTRLEAAGFGFEQPEVEAVFRELVPRI